MKHLLALLKAIPPECWALLVIAIPLTVTVLMRIDVINTLPSTLRGPNDPDPWLRLTLVRDWLNGGSWFDHRVLHTNAPFNGIASPWTRPLDMVISLLVNLQPLDAPMDIKLLRAAAALPLIWMIALLLGLFRAIRQLSNTAPAYMMAGSLIAATPVVWAYFGRGNADHHAPLAALWAWVIAYSLNENPHRRAVWIQGMLMSIMLWISPEALLLIALIYAWPVLRWLKEGGNLTPLIYLTSIVAYGSVLAVVLERPPEQWFTPIYDSISIVHAFLLILCALAVRPLAFLPKEIAERPRRRWGVTVMAGLAVAITMAIIYPRFFFGPMADADPFIFTDFLPRINEAKPLLSKPPLFIAALLFMPMLALFSYLWMQRCTDPVIPRRMGLYLLYLLCSALILVLSQLRWHYYLFPITAIMLAPVLATIFEKGKNWPARLIGGYPEWQQTAARITILLLVLLIPLTLFTLNPDNSAPASKRMTACERSGRALIHSGQLRKALGAQPLIVYAPTNLGAEILFYTPYKIVASNYHREAKGIQYVWNAAKLDDEAALRRHFEARHIEAALICPDTHAGRHSVLMNWVNGGKRPDWTKKIPLNAPHAPLLLRIN